MISRKKARKPQEKRFFTANHAKDANKGSSVFAYSAYFAAIHAGFFALWSSLAARVHGRLPACLVRPGEGCSVGAVRRFPGRTARRLTQIDADSEKDFEQEQTEKTEFFPPFPPVPKFSSACICVICGPRPFLFLCLFGSAEIAKRNKLDHGSHAPAVPPPRSGKWN